MYARKALVAVMLALSLLAGMIGITQADILSNEEKYDLFLDRLNSYMMQEGDVSITSLVDDARGLKTYKESVNFWMYANVLDYLEQEKYADAQYFITVLETQQGFCTMLKEDPLFSEQYSAICSVEELGFYVQGRKAEKDGNTALAAEYFNQCLSCMDAMDRFLACRPNMDDQYQQALLLLQQGDYAAAKECVQYLADNGYEGADALLMVINTRLEEESRETSDAGAPVNLETAVPTASFTITGSADKGKVTLRWEKVPGAAKYRIYHALLKNGEKNFSLVTETDKTTIALTQNEIGVNNYYCVEALDNNGNLLAVSNEGKVYVARQQAATPKPTPVTFDPNQNPSATSTPKPTAKPTAKPTPVTQPTANPTPVTQPTPGHSSDNYVDFDSNQNTPSHSPDDDVITNENGDSPAVDFDLPAKTTIGFDDNQNSEIEDWWEESNLPTAAPSNSNDDFDWGFDI